MSETTRRALLMSAALGLLGLAGEATAQSGPAWRRRRRRILRRGRLAAWRNQIVARRLTNRARFDLGRRGEQVLRAEILAINASPAALARARAMGFAQVRVIDAQALGLTYVVLRAPSNLSSVAALDALETADPQGVYELNHVYDPSHGFGTFGAARPLSRAGPDDGRDCAGVKIGMIDAGVDSAHPAFQKARVQSRCFTSAARPVASPHGTAVASLLVGEDDDFRGALAGAQLYAADVFADSVDGGSAEAIANALIWMAQQGVGVVNISLAGPANRALETVCAAVSARGIIIVAAAGNEGPTKPVGFPAAYPGVVAVTAVDAENRVYLGANRGPQIAFSALGVGVEAAVDDGAYEEVSGTSFAAPIVAAELALKSSSPAAAAHAVADLSTHVIDLGAPGRDVVYGYGLVR
jgi:subtilisin family serine protease